MDFKPLSGREFPRFSGIKTFFRLPYIDPSLSNHPEFDAAIFGIPFDGGVSYRPGCRFGPTRIREISALGRGFHLGHGLSVFEKIRVADVGDCPTVPIDQQQTFARTETFIKGLLQKKLKFVGIGGDHSITIPILKSLHEHYGQKLNLIHFDAHLDTYPAAWNCEYHHGTFARHAIEQGWVNPQNMVQIGIRGPLASGADLDFVNKHGVRVCTMDEIRSQSLDAFCKSLPTFTEGITYLSYDIDCLDPAYAPGTGTPVPGGLSTYEVQKIIRALKVKSLVGADIVEISPPYDQSDITALAGVDALFEVLALMARD